MTALKERTVVVRDTNGCKVGMARTVAGLKRHTAAGGVFFLLDDDRIWGCRETWSADAAAAFLEGRTIT